MDLLREREVKGSVERQLSEEQKLRGKNLKRPLKKLSILLLNFHITISFKCSFFAFCFYLKKYIK